MAKNSQQIGTITLTANNAGSVALSYLKLTFSGNGVAADVASSTGFLGTTTTYTTTDSQTLIVLKNSNSVDVLSANPGAKEQVEPYDGTVEVVIPDLDSARHLRRPELNAPAVGSDEQDSITGECFAIGFGSYPGRE